MVKLEDDREALQDARFFDAVDYILIIPQGFAKDFSQGGGTLEKNTRFTSAEGRYADLLGTCICYCQSVPAGGAGAV